MSDYILKLIPSSPRCIADSSVLQEAADLLASFFPDAEVTCESTGHLRFIDPGQNLERIVCPVCGAQIDERWWQQAMDVAHRTGFSDLSVALPCCQAASSLDELVYEWPAGFARFVLEVSNPRGDVQVAQLEQLEEVLGCTLRRIWAHY